MMRVTGQGGPNGYRQVRQIVMMRLRGYGINPDEYSAYGLWRRPQGRVLLRGLLNADLKPAYDRALAFARKVNRAAG